jgi:hypothetical protein
MVIANKLRLFLAFKDEVKQVKVDAETNRVESRIAIMGVVRGKDELQNLLEVAGIDHYLTPHVDAVNNICSTKAHELTPKQIVEGLAKAFQKDHDLWLKILDGKTLSDAEQEFRVPKSFDVFSSTVSTDEGLARVQDWFKAKVAAQGRTAR